MMCHCMRSITNSYTCLQSVSRMWKCMRSITTSYTFLLYSMANNLQHTPSVIKTEVFMPSVGCLHSGHVPSTFRLRSKRTPTPSRMCHCMRSITKSYTFLSYSMEGNLQHTPSVNKHNKHTCKNATLHLVFAGCSKGVVRRYDHCSCLIICCDLLFCVFAHMGVS